MPRVGFSSGWLGEAQLSPALPTETIATSVEVASLQAIFDAGVLMPPRLKQSPAAALSARHRSATLPLSVVPREIV